MTEERSGKLEKLKGNYTTQARTCTECGNEYEAKIIFISLNPIDLSKGLCYDCRAKKEAEIQKQEEMVMQLEISRKRARWREESGIPAKFMNEEFGTFDTNRPGNVEKIYNACLKYAKGFPTDYLGYLKQHKKAYPSLILQSSIAGLGKTHLAASICHHILNRWNGEDISNPVAFTTESELLGKIQETYNYTSEERHYRESEEDIIKRLIYRPLLVLDEVGYERRTDLRFVRRILFRVINGRYNNIRPIILTTNLSVDQLRNYLDGRSSADEDNAERSFDRLWEMANGQVLRLTGESYRRKE
jgi:DNA replication protein DnaC